MNKKILLVLISVILIGFILLFLIYLKPEKKTEETSQVPTEKLREIVVDASRFEYNPSVISVKKGERIKLTINNTDTLHGIRIPELGVADNNVLEFVVERSGQFTWYCNNFCGEGHRQMQGILIVNE